MIPNNPLNWRRSGLIVVYLSSALVLVTGFCFLSCQSAEPAASSSVAPAVPVERPQTGLAETQIVVSGKTYRIEVASTPQQEQTGLMYRTHLAKGHGMLFPFSPSRRVSFWMKNTKIPLDMLFVANGRLLHVFEDVPPCLSDSCPAYGIEDPIDMVLELPAGTARRDHLVAGDPVHVKLPLCAPSAVSGKGK